MAADVRIGGHFLFPGVGFGGSCFPKDLMALQHTGEEHGMKMRVLDAVTAVNRDQKRVLVEKVKAHFGGDVKGKTFALWGLAFKPGTDDTREAPSIEIARGLTQAGAHVRAHDPVARGVSDAEVGDDPYAILEGADGLLLVTEWNAYRSPDFERVRDLMKTKVVFDGRNIWDRSFVESFGLSYYGIGA